MRAVPGKDVRNVLEYLDIVTLLQRAGGNLWFRGVVDHTFELVPGLYRKENPAEEKVYVHAFLVGYKAYVANTPESPWDLYGLMQHHGLPTRLLDWSKSPLHALYFALQEPERKSDRAVWAMQPHELNRLTLGVGEVFCPSGLASRVIRRASGNLNLDAYLPEALDPFDHFELPHAPVAMEPPLVNARIRGQQGCFTVHGADAAPLEEIFPDDSKYLFQLIVKSEVRTAFLKDLNALGINEEAIYQDLDSLVARIKSERAIG